MFSERLLPYQATSACLSLLLGAIFLFVTGYHPFAYYPQGHETLATTGVVFVGLALIIYVWSAIGLMKMRYEVADDASGDSVTFTLMTMVILGSILLINRMPGGWYSVSQFYQDIALVAALSGFMAMYGFGYNEEIREKKRIEAIDSSRTDEDQKEDSPEG